MNIYDACETVATMSALWRKVMDLKDRRYCAKCKTALCYTFAESGNYVVHCEKCNTKTVVKARSNLEAINIVGVKR